MSINLDFDVLRVSLFLSNQCVKFLKSKFSLNCKSSKEEEEKDSAASSASKTIDEWDKDLWTSLMYIRNNSWVARDVIIF